MNIPDNPFTSTTFEEVWISHFLDHTRVRSLDFILGVRFFKHPSFPLYINVGRTNTKGISYEFRPGSSEDLKGHAAIVFDVPGYFKKPQNEFPDNIRCLKSQQYPGFLIDLSACKSLEDYLQKQFSKSSRYKLKKFKKRLEHSFNIQYVMHASELARGEYNLLFTTFRKLLVKRFDDKQVSNNNLDPKEWGFFKEVTYRMMQDGTAGLFVIYSDRQPVSITLVNLASGLLFDTITVFDIDYSKFQPGSITIMGLIEWCIDQQIGVLDFSKGFFQYKERWATDKYHFEYHILYNHKSIVSRLLAGGIASFYRTKQNLRNWGLHKKLHAFTYRLKHSAGSSDSPSSKEYSMEEIPMDLSKGTPVLKESREYELLFKALCEYTYLSGDHIDQLKIYEEDQRSGSYILCGKETTHRVLLH